MCQLDEVLECVREEIPDARIEDGRIVSDDSVALMNVAIMRHIQMRSTTEQTK